MVLLYTPVKKWLMRCLPILLTVFCSLSHASGSALEGSEDLVRKIVASDDNWGQVYNQCNEKNSGGERVALACTASMMLEMELILEVCSDRSENTLECYKAQKLAMVKFDNFTSVPGGEPHDINVALNICSDLHKKPVESSAQRRLLNFATFVQSGKELSGDEYVWFDFQELTNCVEDMYLSLIHI